MTDDRSLDRAARSWLEEGPTRAPDRTVEAALVRIDTTRQERDLRIPWRFPTMFTNRVALAALAILVLIGGGFALTRLTGFGPGGPGATPSPSPTAAPTPSPMPLTPADVGRVLLPGTYRVDEFAAPFSITLPAGWKVSDFSGNTITIESQDDGTRNIYLAVMNKIYADPCHTAGGPTAPGAGVDAVVSAFSSMPGFRVSGITDATFGSATGKVFIIANSIDVAAANCSADNLPLGTYDKSGEDAEIAMFGGETDQFWVLDAGGTRVFMAVTANQLAATRPIRGTLVFGP